MKLRRALLLLAALTLFLAPLPQSCASDPGERPGRITNVEFAGLINQISEDPGYFWSNNYISNETSYQHVLDQLDQLDLSGGVYLGVGPNQNFTYIAAVRPQLAFILDIRRQNMLEHLLFKKVMEKAETRQEYLSLLLGRPVEVQLGETASLPEIVASIEKAAPDAEFFRTELERVQAALRQNTELGLSEEDLEDLSRIYLEFFRQGLNIKYDSWRSFFFPSLKEFLLETDLEKQHRNWLSTRQSYDFVREMELANRIIPVVGDFAGEQAFRRLARLLEARKLRVNAFYVSNVEFYLFRQRKWPAFIENVSQLPITDRSVFIRAYANLHRPHPNMVDNHITVSLVQNIEVCLENARAGRYRNHWDVVTSGVY